MQTFDGALFKLFMAGKVSYDDAIANADSPNNLRLRIKLAQGESPVAAKAENAPAKTSFGELKLVVDEPPEEPADAAQQQRH
jgi:twitching motility protein PilU